MKKIVLLLKHPETWPQLVGIMPLLTMGVLVFKDYPRITLGIYLTFIVVTFPSCYISGYLYEREKNKSARLLDIMLFVLIVFVSFAVLNRLLLFLDIYKYFGTFNISMEEIKSLPKNNLRWLFVCLAMLCIALVARRLGRKSGKAEKGPLP